MVVVHAIFIVINIEFSRLIGDYLSAKFELFIAKHFSLNMALGIILIIIGLTFFSSCLNKFY